MNEKAPSKAEIFDIVNAQAHSLDELSKRLVKIEQLSEKQESRNTTVIIAVLVAAVLIVATVAVQVSTADKRDRERADHLLEKIHEVELSSLKLEERVGRLLRDFKGCIWTQGLEKCLR